MTRTTALRKALASLFLAAISTLGFAQLAVSPQTDLAQLARIITGPGVTISNPHIDCHPQGYGQFQYTGSLLGIDEGILLTNGKITNALGPNNVEDKSFSQDRPGNSLLNIVTGRTTRDACLFEFDVVPAGDSLRFDFVFGSEEYNEWVGSQFNDVFGFFISGPGIAGDPGIGNEKNIALIPGTNDAVAINNVNNGTNAGYFHDNDGGQHIQYDGFTKGLSAFSLVQPCQTYHLKLVIADASDKKLDSGVFIAKVKSNPVTMQLITANGSDSLVEGCNNGLVRFTRQVVDNQPLTLQYYLHGTATNGTDYAAIGDLDPHTPKTITIPAFQASVDQPIAVVDDGISEGLETLLFILGNPFCPAANSDTLLVPIVDSLNVSVVPATSTICVGGEVGLAAAGGTSYSWTPAAGLSSTSIGNPTATPPGTTTYSVTISHGDCSRTLQAEVKVSNLDATAAITAPLCAGGNNGAINLSLSGGIAPYTYQWSGPNGFSATTEDIANIGAGVYTVTITDAACTKVKSFVVGQPAPLAVTLAPSMLVFGQNIACHGGSDGSIDAIITGGTGPYSASWTGPGGFTSNAIDLSNLSAGTYSVIITDAHGCTANASTTLLESGPMAAEITSLTNVTCPFDGQGQATVTATGGMPVYSYSWNTVPAQTGPTATGLAPGSYTVTITDQYECQVQATAVITGPTVRLDAVVTNKTNVSCHGANNGSATISVSGGTPGYTITWNTNPVQTGLTASGLAGGTYLATATDANGCTLEREVVITEPATALSLAVTSQQNINCFGQATGSATVNTSGGTAPYSYSWNTTPPQSGASATGLPAGTWTVSAYDARQCATTLEVEITGPAAPLAASIGNSADVACHGDATGSASVAVTGGTGPYSYNWNTTPSQHAADATGLAAGTWEVAIVDALGCQASASVQIGQPTPITITGTVTEAQCQAAANGAIDLTTSGGTAPYAWSWTGPNGFNASTEDLQNLIAGGYTITVTDAHGCMATRSFDVNQPGLFQVSSVTSTFGTAQVSCAGAADGTIDLTVTGGVPNYQFAWSGPNGYSSTDEDLTGLAAGSYHVTITDQNGCNTSHDVTLAAPAPMALALVASNHNGTSLSCNGGSDGTINTTITGGTPPYNFQWAGPNGFTSANKDLAGLAAGTYQLTVTDAFGCIAAQSTVLTAPAALVASNGGTTAVTCFGSNTGQATVQVSGGNAPYTYTWNTSPQQHAATAIGLAAGAYTVQVADANGCSTGTSITVGGPQAPLALNITATSQVLCHGGTNGSATVAASGGTAPYAYAWNTSPVQTGPTANNLPAGTWIVTVTDAAGCTQSRNVVITQPAQPISATVLQTHPVTCYGDNNGSVAIQVAGGSGNYNIVWNTTPAQTGGTATHLAPGSYVATISDANGCTQALNFPVGIGGPMEPLSVSAAIQQYPGGAHVSCPGSSDGSIDITATGGTPNYQYLWQDGHGGTFTTQDLNGLAAGTYHLEVMDGHGCFIDTTFTLTAPTAITATALVQPAVCHGENNGAIDMTPAGGVAPYSYQWNGPAGFGASSQDLADLAAGVYTVAISDANGCQSIHAFSVTEPGTFTFDAISTEPSCNTSADGSLQVVAGGGTPPYQYAWIGPGGFSANTANISGLTGGTYHLTLTDDNGCSTLFSATLQQPPVLTAFVISVKNHGGHDISCAGAADGQVITVFDGGTAPYTFAWTGPNGFTANTQDIDFLEAGTYTLTITDAGGCTVTSSVTLVEPPALTSEAAASSYAGGYNTSCNGALDGSIVLTPQGGTPAYSVTWSGPNGFSSSSWQITGLAPGTYTATITDNNGCTASSASTLSAPDPLTANATASDIACHGGSTGEIDLQVAGGSGSYSYQWNGPGAFTATSQNLSGIPAGTYEVAVTDVNGCTTDATVTIHAAPAIELHTNIITTECQGANTGAIDLAVSGGTGNHSFLWTGFPAFSATTEDISSLFAGVYTVTVTDDAGCTATASYNVGEPDLFQITATLSNMTGGYHVSCADASDGSISASVTGGTGPYTYFWNGPNGFTAITPNLNDLAPGQYVLTVHDSNGCNAGAAFTLVAPQPVLIGIAVTAQPGCDDSADGSIGAHITGGVAPYSVSWSGPHGSLGIGQNLAQIGAGTYTAVVTDALGCTASAIETLSGPTNLEATASATVLPGGTNISCANAADGSITLAISGGTAPYQVSWSGPAGFHATAQNINNLAAGLYTALITDAHGCTTAAQTTLTAPQGLALGITTSSYSNGNNISCAGAQDGAITLQVSGGSPAYTINWSGPGGFSSTASSLANLAPGNYSVTVQDAAGCFAYASASLIAPPPISTTATLSDHDGFQVGCNGNDGSINLAPSGGLPPYQFAWSGPNGFAANTADLDNLAAGTYTVVVQDANGCSISRSFSLNAPQALSLGLAVTSNECDTDNNGEINLSINGGTSPYTIAWTGPGGFSSNLEDIAGLASGAYQVTVTTAMGCSSSAQATIIAAAPMNLSLYASQYGGVNIPCSGASTGSIELEVNGGFQPLNIHWDGPGGFTASTPNINGLAAGSYTATITDAHGCIRDTSITLIQPDSPLVTTLAINDVLCHGTTGGSITTTTTGGDGPYTFTWRGPDSTSYSTPAISGLAVGDYELVVTDANGCINTLQATIVEPDSALMLDYSLADHNGSHTSCSGAADGAINLATVGGTPGYTYSWSGPDGFTSTADSVAGLPAGTYTITATDANGCTAEATIVLEAAPAITINAGAITLPSGTAISCHGADDGNIGTLVSGGTGTLTWQWSGPNGFASTQLDIGPLAPGTYCLHVQDGNGCEAQQCVTIAEPAPLTASTSTTTANCGSETGTVDATITGGTAPYSFQWSNGAQSEDITQLPAGAYQVNITDANGCTASASAIVAGTPGVEATALINAPTCPGSANGGITLQVGSGTMPFTYAWDDGSSAPALPDVPAGSYPVTITDGNGCTWEETITVNEPESIQVDPVLSQYSGGHNISSWGQSDGSITLHTSGGTAPYTYGWNDGASSAQRQGLPAGTYIVVVTDANGCTVELTILLTQPDDLAMPTGFTPNGDGDNDAFVIHGLDAWPNNQLTVFNRWGNVVFDQLNYRNDWRGENTQGQALPNGTYFVILRLGGDRTLQNYVDLRR